MIRLRGKLAKAVSSPANAHCRQPLLGKDFSIEIKHRESFVRTAGFASTSCKVSSGISRFRTASA